MVTSNETNVRFKPLFILNKNVCNRNKVRFTNNDVTRSLTTIVLRIVLETN